MKKEKSCGAIVFYLKDSIPKILLIKHANSGHWSFPKGHVEAQETETQTAEREIMEETGICAKIDTRFRSIVTYSPKKETVKDVVYFFATAQNYDTHRQEEEVSEVRWIDANVAYDCVSYKNDKILVEKAIEFYNEHYKGERK
ncbi:MAG: NUDIX domain-containing protein [Oscillospiraceae bacterium]